MLHIGWRIKEKRMWQKTTLILLSKRWMEDKVLVITGASSTTGDSARYEYAQRGANLVMVASRKQRLRVVRNNAKMIRANPVIIIAADLINQRR
ncbi:hypothetical protein Bca4012_051266 [Brassica carinata]|uniref:(rape) hypothetical protein n=1 Tax=Brassica napus TaxID=3708 RepID=A0A816K1J6_BRANA|nr:hypothetical protein HID58_048302 [Brassica napus]CAF1918007.1 unnamed protein product [Brassica napus]